MDFTMGNNQPKVSVIIPTCNSGKYLHFCLNSICNQTYKNIEIIVVDNFSKDNTVSIAKRYGARVFQIGNERARQLNFGIAASRGEYIFETGSDMVSDPTYIEEAVNKCKEGYDAIYSSVISKEKESYWWKVKAFERRLYVGCNTVEAAHFFSHKVFTTIGGYDTWLISVEEDFQHRLDKGKYRTGRIKARETHLHEAQTLKEVAEKSQYYGGFIRSYLVKYPFRGILYLFPLRWAYIKHFPLLCLNPDLTIGLIILKIVQYWYGIKGLFTSRRNKLHERLYESPIDKPTA